MTFYAQAIPQVEPPLAGNHLLWMGPSVCGYSQSGWDIQRRIRKLESQSGGTHSHWGPARYPLTVDGLDGAALVDLRQKNHIRKLSFGLLRSESTAWPFPSILFPLPALPCDLFTLEFDSPQRYAALSIVADQAYALALRDGKALAAGGPTPGPYPIFFEFWETAIDTLKIFVINPISIKYATAVLPADEEADWQNSTVIVRGLQLPLREFMPSLRSDDDEFKEANRRLLPGETIDRNDFERATGILRAGLAGAGPPRPLDRVLILREQLSEPFEELKALDPIYALYAHSKWRRVLGFGWFDNDPALVPGEFYEYRITGHFPPAETAVKVYGFHTVPSGTELPESFFLGPLRVRLSEPACVVLAPDGRETVKAAVSRRGIRLPTSNSIQLPALVIDFPSPVQQLILEVHPGHNLAYLPEYAVLVPPIAVPAGPMPLLQLPVPTKQIRLYGQGVLFGVRLLQSVTAVSNSESVVLPPVQFQNTPPPAAPPWATIENLQQPIPVAATDAAPAEVAARQELGFKIRWGPPIRGGLPSWPVGISARPPLAASVFEIEHQQVGNSEWTPLLPDENWFMGTRDEALPEKRLTPFCDLMEVFPESAPQEKGQLDFVWRDAFDPGKPGQPGPRPVPPPGTYHQYRIRSIDAIGRPSPTWCLTPAERLEKRIPPPVPVGPETVPLPNRPDPDLPEPTGVQARVLIKDAPDLMQDDIDLMQKHGAASNLVILRWGWHDEQRKQDPFAREFRIYSSEKPFDRAVGEVLWSHPLPQPGLQLYYVVLTLNREVEADQLKHSTLPAGYPFHILSNGAAPAGQPFTAVVETRVPLAPGEYHVPELGPVEIGLAVRAKAARPQAWSKREGAVAITAAIQYEYVFRDRLNLTPEHPDDRLWIGVSSADDQPYVDDQLTPLENRPGNESGIVPVIAMGHYFGRPEFNVPPPLADVPVLRTPEPANRPLTFQLDLTPYLAGTPLNSGDRIRPERASVEAVFAAYRIENGHILARVLEPARAGDHEQEVQIAEAGKQENPADHDTVVAALSGNETAGLENRFLVFLAGAQPYGDRLFEPAAGPITLGAFEETLPPKPGRWVYRVRKSDAAGHLSSGIAMAKFVVRVPSLTPGPMLEKVSTDVKDGQASLQLRFPSDAAVTHVLAFHQNAFKAVGAPREEDVLRIPNSESLYAAGEGVLLRGPGGSMLMPVSKSVWDADVTVDSDPEFRLVKFQFAADPGERLRVWACTLTRDGVPSLPGGPWSIEMAAPALPAPTLSAVRSGADVQFLWRWMEVPIPPNCTAAVEALQPDNSWKRISPLFPETITGYEYAAPTGESVFRLSGTSPDGRSFQSNTVNP